MIFRRKARNATIPEVRRLSLKPGDSLLVTVPANLTREQYDYIRQSFEENLEGTNVLVVSDTLDVAVVERAPEPIVGL